MRDRRPRAPRRTPRPNVRLLAAVRKRLTRSARLIACALLTTSALAAGQAFTIHELRNARVDPAASDPGRVSYAGFDPTASPRDAVLVLLGGTGSAPSGYKLFAEEALRQGFHVIVLDYSDATSVGSLCRDDLACYGRVRQELIEGVDTSPVVQASKDDAIRGRLGHALGIAKHDPLRGVILFSGPVDGRIQPPYQPARWITADGRWATAQSRMKLFVSTRDGYYPAIRANLVALGFDPSTSGVNVDDGLATSRAGALFLTHVPSPRAHASVIEDAATPRAPNGTARYAPVWDALLAGY